MAANLIAAAALILMVPAVWLTLRLKDRWLGGTLRADLRSDVRPGISRYRYTVTLAVPDAFADLPWTERGRRPHAFRRRSLRSLPSSPTAASARVETSPAERRR